MVIFHGIQHDFNHDLTQPPGIWMDMG